MQLQGDKQSRTQDDFRVGIPPRPLRHDARRTFGTLDSDALSAAWQAPLLTGRSLPVGHCSYLYHGWEHTGFRQLLPSQYCVPCVIDTVLFCDSSSVTSQSINDPQSISVSPVVHPLGSQNLTGHRFWCITWFWISEGCHIELQWESRQENPTRTLEIYDLRSNIRR